MEPLRTLVIAGMRRDKGTFIGLSLLLLLASFALTLTISLYFDLSDRASVLFDEVGAGDVFTSDWGEDVEDASSRIRGISEVGDLRETSAFSAPVRFVGADGSDLSDVEHATTLFEAWDSGIDAHLLTDGLDAYEADRKPPAEGEVYVSPAANVLYQIEVGDEIAVSIGDEERHLTVAGFFEDPQLGTPFMEVKRYLLASQTFDELYALVEEEAACAPDVAAAATSGAVRGAYPLVELDVFLSSEAKAAGLNGQDLARIVQEEAGWGAETSVFSKETLVGYMLMVVQVMTAILAVFALLLFAIALVMCVHSVSAAIEEGYADWGIAKAVGITPALLRRALVLQYALTACVALLVGFAAGIAVEPLAWPPFLLVTGVLVQAPAFPVPALLCIGSLLALLVGAVAVKACKLGRISPLSALRKGAGDVRFSPRGSCKVSGSHVEASLAWRALISQKRRYVGMGVCSLLLCAFISLCFGIGGAVSEDDAVYRAFGIWQSDISAAVTPDGATLGEVRDAIEETASIEREWMEGAVMLNLDGEVRTFVGLSDLGVVDDASLVAGRMPRLENEVALGLNLAHSEGLSVGDELVVVNADGQEKTLLVSGVISSVLNGGNGALLTFEGLQWLTGDDLVALEGIRQYQLANDADVDGVLKGLEGRFGDDVSFEPTGLFGTAANMIFLVRDLLTAIGYAMAAFAALLACVAVALVSRRMLVGERRDLGIYRALGFRVRTLRLSFALRFLCVALVGGALGVVLVSLGGSSMVSSLFGLFGAGAFTIVLPIWMAVLTTSGLALIFAASAYGFSRSIRTMSIQELAGAGE